MLPLNVDTIAYDPRRLSGVNVFQEQQREFATGDRLHFTAPDRKRHIRAGDLATVQQIGADSGLTVKHDNGTIHTFRNEGALHIDHGYVNRPFNRPAPGPCPHYRGSGADRAPAEAPRTLFL
jgi:hypothetical protein